MVTYAENPIETTKKLLEIMRLARLQDTKSLYKNQSYIHIVAITGNWNFKKHHL